MMLCSLTPCTRNVQRIFNHVIVVDYYFIGKLFVFDAKKCDWQSSESELSYAITYSLVQIIH
ncbi:hypothetical protein MAR_002359 [Mya arenaria]|uniref:Uncharacterized protein n=1 Tax=Mya arenaria TaxID=6604 RepID=A0ABY7FHW3_MYAAR|nr:hypothetical protein MAR_002359 [Mya arenaria]